MKYNKICLLNTGASKLGKVRKLNTYSTELKLNAIIMYLSGQYGGYTPVTKMLGINFTNLINWVAIYTQNGKIGLEYWWTCQSLLGTKK